MPKLKFSKEKYLDWYDARPTFGLLKFSEKKLTRLDGQICSSHNYEGWYTCMGDSVADYWCVEVEE